MSSIKMKAVLKDGVTTVKALLKHEMETGLRKDKTSGEVVPAHFIQEVKAEVNGKAVLEAYWGTSISKNPYLSFKFKGGNVGDKLTLSWKDNKGESDKDEAAIEG